MNVSCTQLSGITAIFQRDKPSPSRNSSPFSAISLAENVVAIDVYVIRIPYDRRELLEQFWQDVDESEIPVAVRNSLYHHGLRQGMLSSKIPVSLEKLLQLRDIPPQRPSEQISTFSVASGEILHKHDKIDLVRKQPLSYPVSEKNIIPKLPVLAVVDGYPSGQVYENATGKILITTDEQPDGSVLVKTIPEIHYGGTTRKISSEASTFTPKAYQSKLSFDQLAVETKLLLGQWVVIGPETRQHAGFGRDILSQGDGDPEQILIGIRLRQTSKDGIHDRNDIAVLRISDEKSNHGLIDDEDVGMEPYFLPGIVSQE